MRSAILSVLATTAIACAHAPPPPAPIATESAPRKVEALVAAPVIVAPVEPMSMPSNASYDEALSTPEPVDVNDERMHLTDNQLTSPMNNVLRGCTIPTNAKLTIKTAVQHGHAIGVSVDVRFEETTKAKRVSPAIAKTAKKISACVEHNVRETVWPPNRRRDSFTMEF